MATLQYTPKTTSNKNATNRPASMLSPPHCDRDTKRTALVDPEMTSAKYSTQFQARVVFFLSCMAYAIHKTCAAEKRDKGKNRRVSPGLHRGLAMAKPTTKYVNALSPQKMAVKIKITLLLKSIFQMYVAWAYPWVRAEKSVIISRDAPPPDIDVSNYEITYMDWLLKDENNPLWQSIVNKGPGAFFTEQVLQALWRQKGYTYHVYNARGHVLTQSVDPRASFEEWHAIMSCNGALPLARMFIFTDNDDMYEPLVPPKEAMDIYFDPSLLFDEQESGEESSASD